jgi:HSP20 family protein
MPYITRNLTSDLFTDMDRFFTDFSTPEKSFTNEQQYLAESEITEAADHYLVSVDLPGMKKEDIKIEAHQNTLTISGERKREMVSNKDQKLQRTEKFYGAFKRSFTLPALTQADKIEANYVDGVLQVYIPKTQVAKARNIEIKSEKSAFFDKLIGDQKNTTQQTQSEEAVSADKV